jgi:hypothetical protein
MEPNKYKTCRLLIKLSCSQEMALWSLANNACFSHRNFLFTNTFESITWVWLKHHSYVPCTIYHQSDTSFERRIILIYAKTNLSFGNSFEPNINNFSTVSEWTTVCESCVLFLFRFADGVMCDGLNMEQMHPYENMSPPCTQRERTSAFSICFHCHHSTGSDKGIPRSCLWRICLFNFIFFSVRNVCSEIELKQKQTRREEDNIYVWKLRNYLKLHKPKKCSVGKVN